MEQINFTDEQLLNLINNAIKSKTEFDIDDFTGGSVGITSTHNHTQTNMRVSLFFGYENKKPVTRNIAINNDTFYIWTKALLLKTMSLRNQNLGVSYGELNALMNGVNLSKYSKKVKNSKVEVGSMVDLPVGIPDDENEKYQKLNEALLISQLNKDRQKEKYENLEFQTKENEILI